MLDQNAGQVFENSILGHCCKNHVVQQKRVHFYDSNKVDVSKIGVFIPKMDGEK